jgi:hypothetical protein
MDIGTGIAVAGVWLVVAAAFLSKNTGSYGVWISIIVASIVTSLLV